MRTKRGYLATVLLAGVMIAGYLGMLPLLQSLAAEPAYPDAPAAAQVSAAPLVVSVATPKAQPQNALASSKPERVKNSAKKKNAAKNAKRGTPKGSPASSGGTTHTTTHANTSGSGGGGSNSGGGGGGVQLGGGGSNDGNAGSGGDASCSGSC